MTTHSLRTIGRVGMRVVVAPVLLVIGQSCTDLTETPHNALTPETAFHTDAEILAGMAGVYATLRGVESNGRFTAVEEIPTDAIIIPTRGSDWFDGGEHLDLHNQTWTPNSASTLDYLNGSWNDMFGAIAKSNLMIDVIYKAGKCTSNIACADATSEKSIAELRTLRAFYYYMLQDMFGGVPLVTTTALKQYPRATRAEIYTFLTTELAEAASKLPDSWPSNFYGRVTKGAANAILASVYLNAKVFNNDAAGISATSYNSCASVTGACAASIAAANAVINSGTYSLNANWFANFSQNNTASRENIFVIVHVADQGLGGNWPMRTLHYNQLNTGWGGPWNGWAVTSEAYNQFASTDERKGMWLVGPQRNFTSGKLVTDRNHAPSDTILNPLTFTVSIADANAATEGEGVRYNKFPPVGGGSTGNSQANNFTIYRLSEMYLIRAEAENESGDLAGAIADLAFIHDRHDATNTVASMNLTTQQQVRDAILRERLVEFAGEGKRRTDLIRHGKFLSWIDATLNAHTTDKSAQSFRVIFPVPAPQLASNPQLTQNTGY